MMVPMHVSFAATKERKGRMRERARKTAVGKNNIFAAILRGGSGRTGVEEEKKGRRQEEKDRRNS